jgi:hypothetical protein
MGFRARGCGGRPDVVYPAEKGAAWAQNQAGVVVGGATMGISGDSARRGDGVPPALCFGAGGGTTLTEAVLPVRR